MHGITKFLQYPLHIAFFSASFFLPNDTSR